MFTNMLFCCVHFGTISYSHTKFQFHNLLHIQLYAQICPYYNVWPGAVYCCFNKNYNVYKIFNVARRVSEPHMSAKFHDLVLFSL